MAKRDYYECDICGGEYESKQEVAHEVSIKNEDLIVWNDVCLRCFNEIKGFIASLKKSK